MRWLPATRAAVMVAVVMVAAEHPLPDMGADTRWPAPLVADVDRVVRSGGGGYGYNGGGYYGGGPVYDSCAGYDSGYGYGACPGYGVPLVGGVINGIFGGYGGY
jgi:hypothetical protein